MPFDLHAPSGLREKAAGVVAFVDTLTRVQENGMSRLILKRPKRSLLVIGICFRS